MASVHQGRQRPTAPERCGPIRRGGWAIQRCQQVRLQPWEQETFRIRWAIQRSQQVPLQPWEEETFRSGTGSQPRIEQAEPRRASRPWKEASGKKELAGEALRLM